MISETLLIAIINTTGIILAALITSVSLIYGAVRITERRKLKSALMTAYQDIEVYIHIEKFHNEINVAKHGVDNKVRVRKMVREHQNLALSGKNTLSRVKQKLSSLEASIE